ncbi:MAG: hypothetical protein NNA23_08060 [Nitrospira sp.]|nr:hypothetical protein [Nitrospira sp.]MCP9465252.1 hypothetical protein [Nitrospira sp.]
MELFCKALKQNLKSKQNLKHQVFVGPPRMRGRPGGGTVGIALLLLPYLQWSPRFGGSRANLVALLRMNLIISRDLMAWLDKPFTTPPILKTAL